ncbi:hypothetical protein KKC44_05330 [Patescibacteria group bacterium]|nr:hypothetical protein [Patescibacteria group bacterium]MBU2259996.1 hypothetical protein [Patescibacteria group bacterium]
MAAPTETEAEPPPPAPSETAEQQTQDPLEPLRGLSMDSNEILYTVFNPHSGPSLREADLLEGRPRMTRLLGMFRERQRHDHKMRCTRIAGIYLERELAECLENILVHVRSEVRVAISCKAPVVMRSAGLGTEMCQHVQALTNAHLAEVCAAGQRRAPEMVTGGTADVPHAEEVGQPATVVESGEQVAVTTS